MRSIAIEREFGSGGREIGRMAAKLLDVPFMTENCCWMPPSTAAQI